MPRKHLSAIVRTNTGRFNTEYHGLAMFFGVFDQVIDLELLIYDTDG